MPPCTLLHNPRCSKSRAVKALLDERGEDVTVVDYQQTPLDREGLLDLCRQLGCRPTELLRRNETAYEQHFGDRPPDDASALTALVAAPVLLQRPILVRGDQAVIGRPPEAVLSLLA